jgi:uncharacterized protein (TIGR03435 family)
MVRAIAALILCVLGALRAQQAVAPKFEVASVKPSIASSTSASGIRTGHGRLDAHGVSVKRCIMGAYAVGPHQIFGGPDWLDSDRFEISAKADQPVDDDAALMLMLRDLLAERFKLVVHQETKTVPAYVLEVARNGPKLEKAPGGEGVTNSTTNNTGITIDARNTNMDAFARILARSVDLPVVNHTALEGVFNVKVTWTPERAAARGALMEGPSLFTALQEQLGLRLRSEKAPVPVLVIDRLEKPSEN